VTATVRDAVARAELVVIAVPLPAVAGVLSGLAGAGYTGLITDVTSVKGPVFDLVERNLSRQPGPLAGFVGGHPMAGQVGSGFAAADATLFAGCAWVLCLEPGVTALADWLELAALVTTLDARVVPTTAAEHDRAAAAVSHVPHLLAAALAATVATDPLATTLGAGSFRDGTRVAARSPDLVAAMCGGNAAAVGPALDAVLDALDQARAAVGGDDPIGALRAWLAPGAAARAAWPPRPGTPLELPARPDALLRLGRVGGWVTAVAPDRRTVTAVRPAPPDPPRPSGRR
jgi:prephenate dehydrogenase